MELMAFGLLMKSVLIRLVSEVLGLLRVENPIDKIVLRQPALEHLTFMQVLVADGGRQILPLRILGIGGRLGRIE